ncbi:MAG: hypothetical protein HQM10_18910 [Candidatus Riflebacteria bacterium]|nr:hypothetical protein [Candidatus Riflebacteria bacterium]
MHHIFRVFFNISIILLFAQGNSLGAMEPVKYFEPEQIRLSLSHSTFSDNKLDHAIFCEIKCVFGKLNHLKIRFTSSDNTRISVLSPIPDEIASGETLSIKASADAINKNNLCAQQWGKVHVSYLPDYEMLAEAVRKNIEAYPFEHLRENLLNNLKENMKRNQNINLVSGINFSF